MEQRGEIATQEIKEMATLGEGLIYSIKEMNVINNGESTAEESKGSDRTEHKTS